MDNSGSSSFGLPSNQAASAAAAAAAVVDLTDEPTTNEYLKSCARKYDKEAAKAFKPPPKRQRRRGKKERTSKIDAVDVDALYQTQAAGEVSSGEASKKGPDYRQILGPLRMNFIDSFATAHNAACTVNFGYQPFKKATASKQTTLAGTNLQKLYKELTEFQLNLPVEQHSAIYCRALESDLTKVRCLITGPLDSPYAAGCFMFDMELNDYPHKAPKVRFLTTGGGRVRFNPNLYNDGKVCLSLLGTWQGPGWISNKSTLLQVLVSIQGLILVNDPYFNEPGYERGRGTAAGKKQSDIYNQNLYAQTLQYAVLDMLQNGESNYPEFYPVIQRHFRYHGDFLRQKMQDWANEAPAVRPLVPRIEAALLDLPPLVVKRPPRKPETVSLLDDDDDDDDDEQDGKPRHDPNFRKAPETIDLID